MKNIITLFVLLIIPLFIFADDSIDRFVNGQMTKKKIPGIALLVIKDGKAVKEQGYGFANLEHQVPVTPATIFQSGSMGKQFTATAVMILAEEGKLNIDDPVGKYLKVPATWDAIKIRHLLTHTSGLGDYPDDFDFRKDFTEDQLLEIVTKQPFSFKPGEKWSYSNLGYLTLGILIHKVSGKFYGDFLKERVWSPIGMTSTRIINEDDIVPNRAAGYRLEKEEIKNQEWVSPTMNTTADGSMYFNIVDLAKWDAALNTEKLLKKSSLEQMWTPVKLNDGTTAPYGFGWEIGEVNGHQRIEHGGAWQGFTTHIARYPKDHLSVVVLTNLSLGNPDYIAHAVAGLYDHALAIHKHTIVQIDPALLKQYEGKYEWSPGQNAQIIAGVNHLTIQIGERKFVLLPEGDNSFFVEDSETTANFVKNEKGNVVKMLIHSGVDRELKRLE